MLPLSYQYPLSAIIYKILSKADKEYADFLHETGYKKPGSHKTFKLFTFSNISTPFIIKGDRMMMKTHKAEFMVSFYIPEAATNFVKGLFLHQQINIIDKKSNADFTISQVEAIPYWSGNVDEDDIKEVILKPISPLAVGITNERNNYDFLSPTDMRFLPSLLLHWREKYATVYGKEVAEEDFKTITIQAIDADKAESRLITIKAGKPEQTRIRGFVKFYLKVKAPVRAINLALDTGIAIYGSQGFGAMELVE